MNWWQVVTGWIKNVALFSVQFSEKIALKSVQYANIWNHLNCITPSWKIAPLQSHYNLITILEKAYFFETNCLLLRYYKNHPSSHRCNPHIWLQISPGHNGLRRSAQYPIRRPGADPYARQATPPYRSRPRRQNRVADPVYGGEEAGGDGIVKKKDTDVLG